MEKLSIYKYVRTGKGWRYCKAAFHPNGRIKPNVVIVGGVEEQHSDGRYFLNFNNQWTDVGEDAVGAQRKRLLRLTQDFVRRFIDSLLLGSLTRRPETRLVAGACNVPNLLVVAFRVELIRAA